MKRIRVTVTQEDIDGAVPHTTFACPLARALRRRAGLRKAEVVVGWWWPRGSRTEGLQLPPAPSAFARRYDLGFAVKPPTFLLPVPE